MSTETMTPEGGEAILATLERAQQMAERCRTDWGKDIRDPAIVRWLARCLAEVRDDRIEALEAAVTLRRAEAEAAASLLTDVQRGCVAAVQLLRKARPYVKSAMLNEQADLHYCLGAEKVLIQIDAMLGEPPRAALPHPEPERRHGIYEMPDGSKWHSGTGQVTPRKEEA